MTFALPLTLLGLAAIVSIGSGIWLLVLAFRRSIWWGLGMIFVPCVNIVFTIKAWAEAKRPFLLSLIALPLLAGAYFTVPKEFRDRIDLARNLASKSGMPSSPADDDADTEPNAEGAQLVAVPPVTANNSSAATAPALPPASTAASRLAPPTPPAPLTPAAIPAAIAARLSALHDREALLLGRKKRLKPEDKAGALALSQEIVAYNAELQAALSAKDRLVSSGALTPAPNTPAAGRIAGLPFTVEKALLRDGILTLRQGGEFFADREVAIFLFLKDGESPAGRKWQFAANKGVGQPHVHLSWRENGKDLPNSKIFMSDYQLNLEFDRAAKDSISGRIVLTTPDEKKSTVSGTFTAQIVGKKAAVASNK